MTHMAQPRQPRPATTDKMTGAGYIFLVVSIVLGIVTGGPRGFALLAGIAMLVIASLMYLMGK
jgi:hypothetical protein